MSKIITTFAMSIDNYIARLDGSFDWIVGDGGYSSVTNFFNFEQFLNETDYIVMGKTSYDEGLHHEYPNHPIFVVTTKEIDDETITPIHDIQKWITDIRLHNKQVYIFGGAKLIDSIRNEIDEWIIGIVPTLLGNGRKIFLSQDDELSLKLVDQSFQDGITLLRYIKR